MSRRPDRDGSEPGLDAVFEALGDARRRAVLAELAELGEAVDVRTLADRIVDSFAESDAADRVAGGLYHVHLPKLADAGVVDFDCERGRVALTERGERLVEYLERVTGSRSVGSRGRDAG